MRNIARNIALAAALASTVLLSGCSGGPKVIDGVKYGTYGIANEKDMRNPNIEYEVSTSSVVLAIIFCETVVVPIYIIGWDLYEPVGKLDPNKPKGAVK